MADIVSSDWKEQLRQDGYVRFPSLTPRALVDAARAAIDDDLAHHFDPARQVEYDNQSFCPDLRRSAAITRLITDAPIRGIVDAALGWDRIDGYGHAQIAIRRAHNAERERPPEPHIDGIPTPYNGLPTDDPTLSNFTALVGVYLSAQTRDFAGNFTVWPGSHHRIEQYFRERGPQTMREGMPAIPLGEPVQLQCAAGDVVLCHYQLAHTSAVNLSEDDRCAVYFRLWFNDIDKRRWALLTDIWSGWML
ncbi:MAG: phytanoyl-CoA dioxygenase family protein [Proteobacteria bacterium]|nr:phytanoyl-CoA dioxygenase family protein [Pseudomonadota bacterium]